MAKTTKAAPKSCNCSTGGKCSSPFCPRIAVQAAREAHLPAGSPGAKAADRLAARLKLEMGR